MKNVAVLFLLFASCSSSDDPNVGRVDQALNQDHGCPDPPSPAASHRQWKTVYPVLPNDPTICSDGSGGRAPMRCAMCGNPQAGGASFCVAACHSSTANCLMYSDNSGASWTCSSPIYGDASSARSPIVTL